MTAAKYKYTYFTINMNPERPEGARILSALRILAEREDRSVAYIGRRVLKEAVENMGEEFNQLVDKSLLTEEIKDEGEQY